jgi:hypothetical protein
MSFFLSEKCKSEVCSDLKKPIGLAKSLYDKYNCWNIEYKEINAQEIGSSNQYNIVVAKSV